jgi:hypothetical protein
MPPRSTASTARAQPALTRHLRKPKTVQVFRAALYATFNFFCGRVSTATLE